MFIKIPQIYGWLNTYSYSRSAIYKDVSTRAPWAKHHNSSAHTFSYIFRYFGHNSKTKLSYSSMKKYNKHKVFRKTTSIKS